MITSYRTKVQYQNRETDIGTSLNDHKPHLVFNELQMCSFVYVRGGNSVQFSPMVDLSDHATIKTQNWSTTTEQLVPTAQLYSHSPSLTPIHAS